MYLSPRPLIVTPENTWGGCILNTFTPDVKASLPRISSNFTPSYCFNLSISNSNNKINQGTSGKSGKSGSGDANSEKWRQPIIDVSLGATNRLWGGKGLIWFNLTGKLHPVWQHSFSSSRNAQILEFKIFNPFFQFLFQLSSPMPRCVSRDTSSRGVKTLAKQAAGDKEEQNQLN